MNVLSFGFILCKLSFNDLFNYALDIVLAYENLYKIILFMIHSSIGIPYIYMCVFMVNPLPDRYRYRHFILGFLVIIVVFLFVLLLNIKSGP